MAPPSRLAHYVLRTNQLDVLVNWYCQLLDAKVTFSNDKIAFITYDDEHHRVAFVALEPYAPKPESVQVGFYHAGFAFDSLSELLDNYVRLKALDLLPYRCINHGPTVSFYYRDPDGNDVEMQVDSFPDKEVTTAWMHSEAFRKNPIGILVSPEEMVVRRAAGVPDAEQLRRADT